MGLFHIYCHAHAYKCDVNVNILYPICVLFSFGSMKSGDGEMKPH